jgi:hypothetical protein
MTELLNLGASICTGLIFGVCAAVVVILGFMGTVFALGHKAGRASERAHWEYIWPADDHLFRPYSDPVDNTLHELGIRP